MTNLTLKGRDKTTQLTVLMLWLLLGVFVVYPLARLLAMTFWADGGFTLANLKPFISSWYDRQAAVNSILLGCAVRCRGHRPSALSLPLPSRALRCRDGSN